MFDAYKAVRDAIEARIDDAFASTLKSVCAAHGSKPVSLKAVYRVTNPRSLNVPCIVIGQTRGNVDDQSSASVRTVTQVPVMIALTGANPEDVDAVMDDYITALVRLFAAYETSTIRFSVNDFDAEMPAPYEGANLMQTGVVNISALVVE